MAINQPIKHPQIDAKKPHGSDARLAIHELTGK
jgi:hypothetical protein